MKIIDWLNSHFEFVEKKSFDFYCSYAWTVILLSAVISISVIFVIVTLVALNLVSVNPEFAESQFGFTMINPKFGQNGQIFAVFFIDIFVIGIISSTPTRFGRFLNSCIEFLFEQFFMKIHKFLTFVLWEPISYVSSLMGKLWRKVLVKFCKAIPKD